MSSDTSNQSIASWSSIPFRLSMTLLVISGLTWLGGTVYRALVAFELFIAGTLDFDPVVLPAQESMLYQLIAASSLVIVISYAITMISAVFVFRTIPLRLKEHGWLLMAGILLFMYVPVEIFTAYLDVKFILLWESTRDAIAANGLEAFLDVRTMMRATLSHRIGALSGLPVMAAFCYFTALVVVIWQPMRADSSTSDSPVKEVK
jgi:amino acid transporter